jgi:hypothetical protein
MKLGLVALLLVAACSGGSPARPGVTIFDGGDDDNPPDSENGDGCSVLTQAGCTAGQKCTWVLSTDPTATEPGLGSIACVPNGVVTVGNACTIQVAAAGGSDNCIGGTQCVNGICEAICDNNGGAPACDAMHACVAHAGLFSNGGSATPPAGVCDLTCNPLDDNDFDNVGTELTKSGAACGTDPLEGCTGQPSSTSTTHFECYHATPGSTLLYHGTATPTSSSPPYGCAPGYALAFASDAGGSMTTSCYAFCKPGDAYLGNPNPQLPNGVSPHACNGTDARGTFGDIPNGSADSNGEHCFYSWGFEQDQTTQAVHHSPTSDTVGVCFDHTKFKYDPTGGTNATTTLPPCAALPLHSTTTLAADDLACVSTTLAGLFTSAPKKPKLYIPGWPEFIGRGAP